MVDTLEVRLAMCKARPKAHLRRKQTQDEYITANNPVFEYTTVKSRLYRLTITDVGATTSDLSVATNFDQCAILTRRRIFRKTDVNSSRSKIYYIASRDSVKANDQSKRALLSQQAELGSTENDSQVRTNDQSKTSWHSR